MRLRAGDAGLGCVLLVVLAAAAALRLSALASVPPGLHHDEAVNLWNGYCLLKTGADQAGQRWPVFYMRALGENRSVLFVYLLMPFQAACGLSVWAGRLLPATAGTLTVLLVYWTAARMLDRWTGLAAAALLAVNTTHIQLGRWAHEASLAPLLALLPVAAALGAGLPLDDSHRRPRPLLALLAGLLAGTCCYGYPAVRLFVPALLGACVALNWRAWCSTLQTRRGAVSVLAWTLGLALTLGPLVCKHVSEPELIGKRGQTTWIWSAADPAMTRVGKVLARYVGHFGPEFLFRSGDANELVWPAGVGFLPPYLAVLAVIGLAVGVRELRHNRAVRVLLAGVVLFPVGDCLNWHVSLHALRSSAGLWPLVVLAALGVSRPIAFALRSRLWGWPLAAAIGLAAWLLLDGARFARRYVCEWPASPVVYHRNHVDLLAACDWLRPRLAGVDAVVCTTQDTSLPYLVTLVGLAHDPAEWFAQPRELRRDGDWERCVRYGKFYFPEAADRAAVLRQLAGEGDPKRVILLLRADEPAPGGPVATIIGPGGQPALLVYDCRLPGSTPLVELSSRGPKPGTTWRSIALPASAIAGLIKGSVLLGHAAEHRCEGGGAGGPVSRAAGGPAPPHPQPAAGCACRRSVSGSAAVPQRPQPFRALRSQRPVHYGLSG